MVSEKLSGITISECVFPESFFGHQFILLLILQLTTDVSFYIILSCDGVFWM